MKILAIIPARGGSKGLPGKNIKPLLGKPLIHYSIDIARSIADVAQICVSTDDPTIKSCVEQYGLEVPFLRPSELATDTATTNDVLVHALKYYEDQGETFDAILLLQPTSPLRKLEQVNEAIALYNSNIDMVVSVFKSHASSVIAHENSEGYLEPTLNKNSGPRQSVPDYYEYNGAIYVINPKSLLERGISSFTKRIKYIMPAYDSYDIDTALDWLIIETILKNK